MSTNPPDARPAVWIGHVGPLRVRNLRAAAAFYERLGIRVVAVLPGVAVLELRGGTHLILTEGTPRPGPAPFDFMVDDLAATRRALVDQGLAPSPIARGRIHSHFTVEDLDGNVLKFNDSHVAGPV